MAQTSINIQPVAPRVGAWIETFLRPFLYAEKLVAPRVGAWIETSDKKHLTAMQYVAPRVGAWIETDTLGCVLFGLKSHPEWVRGLKLGHTSIATTQI